MAIPIIGATRKPDEPESPLPKVDVDLPPPSTVPANNRIFDDAKLRELLASERPVVRAFAVEQASQLETDEWSRAILDRVGDQDEVVAADAIHALELRKYKPAAEAIAERFKNASTPILISAARALGELAPERLLELVKNRGRLEDEAYGATATAVACIGSNEVVEYLDKALNRAGALTPERRGALYGAALLSGSPVLANRVVLFAIEDSKKDEPEGASYPSRGALAAIAGMPLPMSRKASGLELFDFARRVLESEILPLLDDARRPALEDAMKRKSARDVLTALEPVLELPEPASMPDEDRTVASMPRRRRGLLRALIDRRDDIGALDAGPAAVFVSAAAQSASAIAAGGANDAFSPAIISLVKALESNVDAHKLAAMPIEELTAFFKEKTERQMRRVHNILTHERTRQLGTLARFANAIADAGHAAGLFEAAADVDDEGVHATVIDAIARNASQAEELVVDALTRTPLEPKLAVVALEATERVRTQRIAVAVGRRFNELRELARVQLVRSVMRLGDPRLIPFVASRAFSGEPEEFAQGLLSLVNGVALDEKLEKAIAAPRAVEEANVTLPLRCKRCKEVLTYGFERVLLDIESKDQYGDPAYVGDTTCKACGAIDMLEPTDQAGQIITAMMMDFLAAARRGLRPTAPIVAPAQTTVHGKPIGFAGAMRALDKDIAESPDSIRPRLHRARLKLILQRRGVEEDIEAVLRADARSPEARALEASLASRSGDNERAKEQAAEALRLLNGNPPARVYDAEDPRVLTMSIEDLLVELERRGIAPPPDLDLAVARARRLDRERELMEQREEQIAEAEDEGPPPQGPAIDPEILARTGRNDPCPCGSGKKFKKCHGKGR